MGRGGGVEKYVLNPLVWSFLEVNSSTFPPGVAYHLTSYNPGQNIWSKTEKFSKIAQYKKSLISTFECFLTAIVKV